MEKLRNFDPKILNQIIWGWVPSSLHLSIFFEVFTISSYYTENQEKRKQFSFRKTVPLNSGGFQSRVMKDNWWWLRPLCTLTIINIQIILESKFILAKSSGTHTKSSLFGALLYRRSRNYKRGWDSVLGAVLQTQSSLSLGNEEGNGCAAVWGGEKVDRKTTEVGVYIEGLDDGGQVMWQGKA